MEPIPLSRHTMDRLLNMNEHALIQASSLAALLLPDGPRPPRSLYAIDAERPQNPARVVGLLLGDLADLSAFLNEVEADRDVLAACARSGLALEAAASLAVLLCDPSEQRFGYAPRERRRAARVLIVDVLRYLTSIATLLQGGSPR